MCHHVFRRALAVLLLPLSVLAAPLQLKRVSSVPTGPRGSYQSYGCVVDTDHDGWLEYVYQFGSYLTTPEHLDILEYRPVNRYELVKSDSAEYPPPPGRILAGNLWPTDAGDIDRDGKADLVGDVLFADSASGEYRSALCTVESPDSVSYPDSMNWLYILPGSSNELSPIGYADLDRDGRQEIVQYRSGWTLVFENVGDDRESLVYSGQPGNSGRYAVADFDQNGATDYAGWWIRWARICECVGDNQYVQVCSLSTGLVNGYDIFLGNDVDRSGRPEFFITFGRSAGIRDTLILYLFEATAEHEYAFLRVDAVAVGGSGDASSLCVDLDRDGIEEVVWSCRTQVIVLKATGPREFERVFTWFNDSSIYAACNAGDFNGNGYNELLVGGWLSGGGVQRRSRTVFLEVEAVRVLDPDTTAELRPGDTCAIRWRVYAPPRCDSVSLFLKTDTVVREGERFWRLDTIVTGLAPTDSVYPWVVPDTVLAWAKVVAIAYGPGWQFDESDRPFRVVAQGKEAGPEPAWRWSLSVRPVPGRGAGAVRYTVPQPAVIELGLYDAGGRLAAMLARGAVRPGRHTARVPQDLRPGVYFCRLAAPGYQDNRKLVLVR